jgi:hypothetical protein
MEGLTQINKAVISPFLKTKYYSNWKFELNYFNKIKVIML